MRRYSLAVRRLVLVLSCTVVASLAVAASAQAVVANDAGGTYGVALVPNTSLPNSLQDNWNAGCDDPSLAPELTWQTTGLVSPLCYHGGSVLPGNETYVLTWDPDRNYWATTRQYVEQFLSDVAAASGSFASPFALTPQYTETDQNGNIVGRAGYTSVFAGGCIDYGNNPSNDSGYTCQFGANHPSGTGNAYPASGCTPSGHNVWGPTPNGPLNTGATNGVCLTDAQIQTELQAMLPQMGLPGGNVVKSGIQLHPLVDVLLPPGVEVCLDSAGHLCSANSDSGSTEAQFCSYHSQVDLNGTDITYVVQPWTAQWGQGAECDDPAAPNITLPVDQTTLAQQVGAKLVSPLSQGNIAAIVNPQMDGWYGAYGTEINDNGCGPLGGTLDNVSLNGNTYALQREFNNAGAIETDPNALPCSGTVLLNPAFVVPGPIEPGDNVLFDGSVTASTLMVHNGAYQWNFGDGTGGTGPSVYHQYSNPGNYQVKLTVTDRGGNTASITQTIQVLGSNGQPLPPPTSSGSGSGSGSSPGLLARLQLLPQSLKAVLRNGISVRVTSNQPANGIATVWITRGSAKKAHIQVGKSPTVRIGLGTVSSVKNGTVTLRLYLSKSLAKKLSHLHHVAMTIRLSLVAPGNKRLAIVAAGKY